MKQLLAVLLCISMSGCCCIRLQWNKLRVGKLDDRIETLEDGSRLEVEETLGIRIKWAPDVDWSDYFPKW